MVRCVLPKQAITLKAQRSTLRVSRRASLECGDDGMLWTTTMRSCVSSFEVRRQPVFVKA